MKYYSLENILKTESIYNMIIGERSNGKTYSVLKYGVERFYNGKGQLAIVRRWKEDFIGKRGATMFDGLVSNGEISRITGGQWNGVYYYSSRWFLCRHEDGERVATMETPFAYGFSIASMEHDKSTSYPEITTILFDEFLTRGMYLADEFVQFLNVVSTIVRQRTNVKIFMLGNTVNKYCPYFAEMGLNNVAKMKQGTIDVYKYGDSGLRVAVEYCDPAAKKGKASDIYFAFDNPKLEMITGGAWEIDLYPHLPYHYAPKEVLYTFFLVFSDATLQCEIIQHENDVFIFIHQKTTELQERPQDLIYSTEYRTNPLYRRNMLKPALPVERKILELFRSEKVFYQDNEIGEIVRNYLNWCKSN